MDNTTAAYAEVPVYNIIKASFFVVLSVVQFVPYVIVLTVRFHVQRK